MFLPAFMDSSELETLLTTSDFSLVSATTSQPVQVSYAAIESLRSWGVSYELICDVVSLVGSEQMNYGNTLQKCLSFERFYYSSYLNAIRGSTNIGAVRLESGVGGDCLTLNYVLYSGLIEKKILDRLSLQTGERVLLSIYEGTSRTHFMDYPEFVHRFLVLEIGQVQYLLDGSFGEFSLLAESGYALQYSLEYSDKFKEQMSGIYSDVGKLGYNESQNFSLLASGQMSTLGILDTGNRVVNYSFTQDTATSTVIPMINTLAPAGELIHSFTHPTTGENIHVFPEHIDLEIPARQQIEQILQYLVDVEIVWE